jgi:hypothetical protein
MFTSTTFHIVEDNPSSLSSFDNQERNPDMDFLMERCHALKYFSFPFLENPPCPSKRASGVVLNLMTVIFVKDLTEVLFHTYDHEPLQDFSSKVKRDPSFPLHSLNLSSV